MITVKKSLLNKLNLDLQKAVDDFTAALEQHKFTEGVPAPVSWPFVEAIVRDHAGQFTIEDDVPPPLPPPPRVPPAISPLQLRRALRAAGLMDEVKTAVAAQGQTDPDFLDAFEYALYWRRTDPLIAQLAAKLTPPLTEEDLDNLFIQGATL